MELKTSGKASKIVYVSCELVHSVHSVKHTSVKSVNLAHSAVPLAAKPSAASSTAPAVF